MNSKFQGKVISIKQRKIKVIVADDHPVFREGIVATIKDLPFISKIKQAANGEEVIRLLEGEPADIILMDIKMEPLNGIKTAEILKSRYPTVKIIVLSMYAEEKYILQLVKLGVVGYLIKNATKQELIEALQTVSKGNTYFTKNVSEVLYKKLSDLTIEAQSGEFYSKRLEKLHEVIYLMSLEKTSMEISNILCMSRRTIEDYRLEILKMTNSKNIAGVIKYAYENGILEDLLLIQRVQKFIQKAKRKH